MRTQTISEPTKSQWIWLWGHSILATDTRRAKKHTQQPTSLGKSHERSHAWRAVPWRPGTFASGEGAHLVGGAPRAVPQAGQQRARQNHAPHSL